MASVWGELKRRNVVKVAAAYAIVGWLLIEVAATVFPVFQLPEWTVVFVAMLLLLGFPVALILSWAYELTPDGMERTKSVPMSESITEVTGRKLDFVIIGILAIAVAFFAVERFVLVEEAPIPLVSADDRRSIAVLPFDNRSAQSEDEFFVGGIHDDILTQLAKIGALKVISRTSVMEYRDVSRNMREIGEQLGVATILEGGVQRAGDTIRINAQLIDAETDEHLWAEIYDRELTAENIFTIQSEIATSIADALEATLSPQEVDRLNEVPTQNTRAYDFFLSGKEYQSRGVDNRTDLPLAVQQYERAVEEDPEFALAWARLAAAHIRIYWAAFDRTDARRRTALSAVERALGLQPDLPEAHYAMARYHYHGYRNYEEALRELAIAEQGMPGDVELIFSRAAIYRRQGQWEQVLTNFDRVIELDPRSVTLLWEYGATYRSLRDYAQAEHYWDQALEIAPDALNPYQQKAQIPLWRDGDVSSIKAAVENAPFDLRDYGHWFRWTAAIYERDYETALTYLDDMENDVFDAQSRYEPKESWYGVTYLLAGEPELAERRFRTARAQVEEALAADPEDPRLLVALGEVLAGLGEREAAVRAAHRAMDLLPTSFDALAGPTQQLHAIIRVFAPAGAINTAIEELDAYLAAPGVWSIEGLLPDPRLDPIRDDPRFQALVEKYSR